MDSEAPWTVASASARLSEVIERAQRSPQTITHDGKPTVVVVSSEEWARKTARKEPLGQFLMNSPLRGSELEIEDRAVWPARDLDL